MWHIESGYSKRSKVETAFYRYKAIVGAVMRARGLSSQRVEARIGCKSLNTMTALGMPDGVMVGDGARDAGWRDGRMREGALKPAYRPHRSYAPRHSRVTPCGCACCPCGCACCPCE